MDLRVITTPEGFATLGPAWGRLYDRSGRRSLFSAHAWLDAAWQWQSPSAGLYIVCCERDGELVGMLPLMREGATAGDVSARTLTFLAVPDTQRCDVLVDRDESASSVNALADELVRRQREWDVLRLRYLPAEAIAVTTFAAALAERGLSVDVRSAASNPCIALDRPWNAYYDTRSRRLKKATNLAANRLARSGAVDVRWLAPRTGDRAEVDRALNDVIGISARSWKTRTGNSLDQPGPQAFIRRLSHHAHERGWLSIWTLSLDNVPIAMEYQLVDDGNVYALRSDFDASYESLSPGSHLSRCMLETLFGRGFRRYLMGPGGNAYKYRWADAEEPVFSMTAYGRSLKGRALGAWELAVKPAARRLRDRLQPRAATTEKELDVAD